VPLVAKDVEDDLADPLFGLVVPLRRQGLVRRLHRRDLLLTVLPGSEIRQVQIVALAGHVAPPHRALLVHGHGEPVGPEEVEHEVAKQLVLRRVLALRRAVGDVDALGRLRLEVTTHHGRELVDGVDDAEVQLPQEVRRKNESPVAVDHEWLGHLGSREVRDWRRPGER